MLIIIFFVVSKGQHEGWSDDGHNTSYRVFAVSTGDNLLGDRDAGLLSEGIQGPLRINFRDLGSSSQIDFSRFKTIE